MAHAARHANQTVDTSKAHADGPESCAFDNPLTSVNVASFKRQDSASSACHAPMQVVLRVRLETRVADFEAMRFEERSDAHGVRLLLLHANTQSLDTTEEEPGIKRRKAAARSIDCEEQSVS